MIRLPGMVLLFVLAGALLLPVQAAPAPRLWTSADLVTAAAEYAGKLDRKQAQYARFVSFHAVAPAKRGRLFKALGLVVNSLSRSDLLSLPAIVPGTDGVLAWFDLSSLRDRDDARGLRQLAAAFDRLGELGSGPAPTNEPYFHAGAYEDYTETIQQRYLYGWWYDQAGTAYREAGEGRVWRTTETRYEPVAVKKRRRKVALSPALNRATAIGLSVATGTNFPLFDARWLIANALVEPRYHELLGLDDTEASAKKLAAVDVKTADRVGAQTRGAVLFSEVAHHNRILERTPTALRFGKGTYQESFDYKTSIDRQDVLKDLLQDKPDAKEIIFTIPNGLLGFFVVDGNGKRLDKADGDVAANRRSRFRDTQVRTAYHCLACHLPDRGWIEIDDEVAEFAKARITLASVALEKKGGDRGKRVRQKYLSANFNELIRSDQAAVEAAVRAATNGLTSAETAKLITDAIYFYNEDPAGVTVEQLALELGVSRERLLRLAEAPGVDHTLVGLRIGRKQRRDQVEQAYASISTLLYLGK